jgi:hypothetical protein
VSPVDWCLQISVREGWCLPRFVLEGIGVSSSLLPTNNNKPENIYCLKIHFNMQIYILEDKFLRKGPGTF